MFDTRGCYYMWWLFIQICITCSRGLQGRWSCLICSPMANGNSFVMIRRLHCKKLPDLQCDMILLIWFNTLSSWTILIWFSFLNCTVFGFIFELPTPDSQNWWCHSWKSCISCFQYLPLRSCLLNTTELPDSWPFFLVTHLLVELWKADELAVVNLAVLTVRPCQLETCSFVRFFPVNTLLRLGIFHV